MEELRALSLDHVYKFVLPSSEFPSFVSTSGRRVSTACRVRVHTPSKSLVLGETGASLWRRGKHRAGHCARCWGQPLAHHPVGTEAARGAGGEPSCVYLSHSSRTEPLPGKARAGYVHSCSSFLSVRWESEITENRVSNLSTKPSGHDLIGQKITHSVLKLEALLDCKNELRAKLRFRLRGRNLYF